MTDDFEEDVFEVMDDLRGDNRVAVPDVGTIRRRARKQQNRMRAAVGAACFSVAAVGVGAWASAGDSPATTETAGLDHEGDQGVAVLPAVASDSAPVEIGGPDEIDSKESFGEWMLANRLRDDRRPFVTLMANDDDPTTDGVHLHISAFPLDGSFEYFTVVRAECGPRLQYGMIEFADGMAKFFEGRLPETESIGWGDVGYDCSPPDAEELERVLFSEFEIVPTTTGLTLRNGADQVSFALTDTEGNPLVELPEPAVLRLLPPDEAETSIDVLTGEPEGSRGMNALSSFTLQYDSALNCLYHDEPDNNGEPGTGGRVVIIWPEGYTAVSDEAGVAVRNPAGDVVARSGETFQIGGGMRTGGSGQCGSIGDWIANGGPKSGVEQESAPTTTTDFSATPVGVWTARSVVVDGVELLHPTNAQTLTITDETLSANDGCSTSSGPAQWDASGAFSRSGDSTSTLRACANDQESADAFNAALRATTRWTVTSDGVLLLISPTSRIELT